MTIEELRERCPLPDLFRKLGIGGKANKITTCPLHDDKSPSFGIYFRGDRWKWKCFSGCGGGDEVDFLQTRFAISRSDAIKRWEALAQ